MLGRVVRVFFCGDGASVRGRVVSMEGAPVEGASFRLQEPEDWALMPPVDSPGSDTLTIQSDADGRYAIELLDPQFIKITAVHSQYPETTVPLTLAVGQTTVCDIVMTGLATVEGMVYANGEPATRGNVSVMGEGMTVSKSGEIQKNGYFRVTDVPAGTLRVTASLQLGGGHRSDSAEVTTRLGHTTVVDLEISSGTATITGRVVHNGEPVTHASVGAGRLDGGDSASDLTGPDGAYQIGGLFGGTYRVSVVDVYTGKARLLGSAETSVAAGETATLDLDVEAPDTRYGE